MYILMIKNFFEVSKVLEDGVLSEEESNYILSVFNEIVHPDFNNDENIDFDKKYFV